VITRSIWVCSGDCRRAADRGDGYFDADIVTFYVEGHTGRADVSLLQHVTQLNVP